MEGRAAAEVIAREQRATKTWVMHWDAKHSLRTAAVPLRVLHYFRNDSIKNLVFSLFYYIDTVYLWIFMLILVNCITFKYCTLIKKGITYHRNEQNTCPYKLLSSLRGLPVSPCAFITSISHHSGGDRITYEYFKYDPTEPSVNAPTEISNTV